MYKMMVLSKTYLDQDNKTNVLQLVYAGKKPKGHISLQSLQMS